MTAYLNRREDGSLALYIDRDLQFDSRDEGIYHEALALAGIHRFGGSSPLRYGLCEQLLRLSIL